VSQPRQASVVRSTTAPGGRIGADFAPAGVAAVAAAPQISRALPPAGCLTLAHVDNYELVTKGLTQMLAPYEHRVRVLPHAGRPVVRADLVLMDPYVHESDLTYAEHVVDSLSLGRQLVIYTWAPSSGLGGLRRLRAAGWPIRGWLSKTLPADDLVRALERIHGGQRVAIDEAPSEHRLPHVVRPLTSDGDQLTVRESEVVSMIAQGLSNQEIADAICLSINTVKSYIRSSYRKMGVATRTQAVLWSVHHGLDVVPWQVVRGVSQRADTVRQRQQAGTDLMLTASSSLEELL
jgi:DNA-binding NarL/FixJ family response regulator